jgi:hypothetical protein
VLTVNAYAATSASEPLTPTVIERRDVGPRDFAAESAYAQLLHDTLAADGIHVAQLIIPGAIIPGHPRKDPALLAQTLWSMHQDRHGFRHFADDLDA